MGLESIRIENFRTCRSVELSNLGHLTVLVGRNGVGKSNILQAIERIAASAASTNFKVMDLFSAGNVNRTSLDNVIAKLRFSLESYTFIYSLKFNCNSVFDYDESLDVISGDGTVGRIAYRKNGEIYSKSGNAFAEIGMDFSLIPAIVALKSFSESSKNIVEILNFFRKIKYYPLNEPVFNPDSANTSLVFHDKYIEWLNKTKSLVRFDDSVIMRLLYIYLERRDDFEELDAIFGLSGLGLLTKLRIIEPLDRSVPDIGDFYLIRFEPGQGWEDVESIPALSYEALSYGTRRIINLLVSIFYDKNSVYLFEQPEDGIHPDLLRKLIGFLRVYEDRGQIIMTSHSSALLDYMKPEEIRLVTMVAGETQVRALTDLELEGAKRFMEEEGPLSEYLDLLPED